MAPVPPNGVRPPNCEEQSVDRTTDKAPDKAPDNWTAFRVLSGALSGALSAVTGATQWCSALGLLIVARGRYLVVVHR